MTRILIAGLIALVAGGGPRPAAPQIVGPRSTTDRTPTFRFASHEPGVRPGRIRFRCAVDGRRLHPCRSRFTPALAFGPHTLRARALDPKGRASRTSVARVLVVRPMQRADQTIQVGEAPYNVAAGFDSVWVTVLGRLVRLDPSTGAIQARIAVGSRPWGVAVGEGAVWVGDLTDGTVTKIDPATNTVVWQVTVRTPLARGSPVGVAAGGGSVWAADNSSDEIWRLDAATGEVLGEAHAGDAHEFAGFDGSAAWVSSEDGTIAKLDPATGAVVQTVVAGLDTDFLGFSPGAVWASNYRGNFLWRLDPATGAIAAKLDIGGGGAQGVAFDGSTLWVALYNAGEVVRVNPASGHVQRRIRIGEHPRGLAIAGGSVWVANSETGTVSRIRLRS